AERLREKLVDALALGTAIAPLLPITTAAYFPLFSLPEAPLLLEGAWPAAVRSLLAQQISEPQEEQRLRNTIPRLTGIENGVSVLVRQQYEQNPYPRWVTLVSNRGPQRVSEYLRQLFPAASFSDAANDGKVDILIAGCGTGQQSIA